MEPFSLLAVTLVLLDAGHVVVAARREGRAYDLQFMWPMDNTVDENVCEKNIERIFRGHVVAPIPPDISGDWTSSRYVHFSQRQKWHGFL